VKFNCESKELGYIGEIWENHDFFSIFFFFLFGVLFPFWGVLGRFSLVGKKEEKNTFR